MEDGAKEEPTQCKEPKFLGKAGWVKKAPGRLLAAYKDRYIHVERTEVVVYENEDLQNCLERFDLENYDKCHELKSPFKRKHRLILIRSPKTVNKVHDVKFQAQTAEEKEAWIKALSDGINRAKNKIFDEVKIDESSNLEHVTRTRPKGNRNRRPPTRIHMKEVADVSSDGILRLDLDLENALMPNGTHQTTVDGTETPKDSIKSPESPSNVSETTEKQTPPEDSKNEPEVTHPKKVLKPPMPPIKEAKPSATPEDEADKDDGSGKKVVMPPMPPSKEAKPSAPSAEGATEEANSEEVSEKSPDAKKKAGPPPTPPNKPSSSSSMSSTAEPSQIKPNAPTPPSKEKKPSQQAVEPDQEVQDTTEENTGKEEHKKEVKGTAVETDESEEVISKEALPRDDQSECPRTEVSEEKSGETDNSSDHELARKSPSPLLTSKKESEKPAQQHTEDKKAITDTSDELDTASDTSASSPQAEEAPPKSEAPSVVVSLNDPVTDSLSLSPLLSHSPGQKKKMAEEKSVDSGQHSDDDSEISGSEDTLAVSTAALRGSSAGLDVFDTSEDDIQISSQQPKAVTKPQVRPKVFPHRSQPTPPAKPLIKARSASSGDLLSDSSACPQVRQPSKAVAENDGTPTADDVTKLQAEVALEMEKTSRLLSTVSQSQKGGDGESMPEDLLAKAMEKLMKADNVLREVEKLKPAKNSSNRKSW